MLALAKMQAQVDKLRGLEVSVSPNRRILEVPETGLRSKSGTDVNSSVNWHLPGGTSDRVGSPVREDAAAEAELMVNS
jgi:hypothetical protein